MPSPDHRPRLDRSQGTLIFWGLISVCFAAGACYYFWKNEENESRLNRLREENAVLQDERANLDAEKKRLLAGIADSETNLKAREDLLQQKEDKLADAEKHLGAPPPAPTPAPSPTAPSRADLLKKFSDTIHQLDQGAATEVIAQGGRPVLRVANVLLFAPGEASLKPDGKTLLTQIAQALQGQLDGGELRIETFTDADAEPPRTAPDGTTPKPRYPGPWELTAARATAITRFLQNQPGLPPQSIIVLARGDSQPAATTGKDARARNRRIEITLVTLMPPETTPLAPPPDTTAPAKSN